MKSLNKKASLVLSASLAVTLALTGCTNNNNGNNGASQSPQESPSATEGNSTYDKPGLDPSTLSDLNLSVLGALPTDPKTPTEDVLTPIWRANTKVIPKIVEKPKNIESFTQFLQLQQVAKTMPDILAPSSGVFNNPEVYNYLKKDNILREITLEDIQKYMPRTAERYEKYGVTLEDWYNANVDPTDGKLWYIPGKFSIGFDPAMRDTAVFTDEFGVSPLSFYFRDDILKQVFPNARTEEELRQLYVDKGGKLTLEDVVGDVPITTMDELTAYLEKVKELSLKQGDKAIIPSHLQLTNTADSIWWSMFGVTGLWWQDGLNDRVTTNDSLTYAFETPNWKTFTLWMNELYNKGLSDKEIFIQKEDQKIQKTINGEYAVFHPWLPIGDARAKAKEENRGYGFRAIPLFLSELTNEYQDFSTRALTLTNNQGAVGITTNIKDEQIPQILNWIDWNLSEEAGTLRTWGPPEFYTGEGADRRFKPEYKELEAWAVTGTKGEKDGSYYGIYNIEGEHSAWNHETYGIGGYMTEAYAPVRVYVQDKDSVNIDNVVSQVIRQDYLNKSKIVVQKPLGQDAKDAKAAFDAIQAKFTEITKVAGWQSDGAKNANVTAIIDKPENFEKNFTAIMKFDTKELMDSIAEQSKAWAAYQSLLAKYQEPAN